MSVGNMLYSIEVQGNTPNEVLNRTRFSPIFAHVEWILVGLSGGAIVFLLCRILRMGGSSRAPSAAYTPLRNELQSVYQPVALEVQTLAAILGISLNDAFEERDVHHHELAWRMVRLSACEWERLAEVVTELLRTLAKNLPKARTVAPIRGARADFFKSRTVIDYVHMHELLDQLVFSSRLRFHLQIRLLLHAVATLTREFRRACRYGEQTLDPSPEVWTRLDHYFHDLDVVAKESLLAFRSMMSCLPSEAVGDVSADLNGLVQRGVRVVPAPIQH